jgi:hypothetical protein
MNGLQVSKRLRLQSLFVLIKSPALRSATFTLLALVVLSTGVKASQFEITGPVGSAAFGTHVIVLPNGNIVVTDPNFAEAGKTNIGAVYLFDGATLALISTQRETQPTIV